MKIRAEFREEDGTLEIELPVTKLELFALAIACASMNCSNATEALGKSAELSATRAESLLGNCADMRRRQQCSD